jgi:hypothetical protein
MEKTKGRKSRESVPLIDFCFNSEVNMQILQLPTHINIWMLYLLFNKVNTVSLILTSNINLF